MPVFIEIAVRILLFLSGLLLVGLTLLSAIRTFVLPRSEADPLVMLVFWLIRRVFDVRVRFARSYSQRDRIMAFYAPLSLMALLPTWYVLVALGYAGMYWAVGMQDWYMALRVSLSSLTTLGFEPAEGLGGALLAFTEATIGLILVALLISYLPTMYSAFSHREAAVTMLEIRAGDPPSAVEMIKRYYRIHGMEQLGETWRQWEAWFADIEESHTSLAALVFFRSPQPGHSWVTAAGTVLNAASLVLSAVDTPYNPQAALCIRGGYLALRRIADYFSVPYDNDPRPGDPISIRRADFDAACADLAAAGVPLKNNLDQAWHDFAGWRVNYDQVLLALGRITMAPHAPWTSDSPENQT